MCLGLITPGAVLLVRSKTFLSKEFLSWCLCLYQEDMVKKLTSSVNTLKVTDKKKTTQQTKQQYK